MERPPRAKEGSRPGRRAHLPCTRPAGPSLGRRDGPRPGAAACPACTHPPAEAESEREVGREHGRSRADRGQIAGDHARSRQITGDRAPRRGRRGRARRGTVGASPASCRPNRRETKSTVSEAIRSNQRQSEAISGDLEHLPPQPGAQSEAIRGNLGRSRAPAAPAGRAERLAGRGRAQAR